MRGFALPRLQAQLGALRGTLLLGVLWGLWHLPAVFIEGFIQPGVKLPLTVAVIAGQTLAFIVAGVVFSLLFTWVFNQTGGSLLIMILLHAAMNANNRFLLALLPSFPLGGASFLGTMLCVLLILVLTKGRLGYQGGVPTQTGRSLIEGETADI